MTGIARWSRSGGWDKNLSFVPQSGAGRSTSSALTSVSSIPPWTHAIPWALHGKAHAKAHLGKTRGDKLDKAIRHCSSNQTAGIPIGPDASIVIAEIVLTAVDKAFKKRIPNPRGFRYFDDYEAAFKTRAEAEEAQSQLEASLEDFEATLNPSKTYVLELPQPFKTTWTRELSVFEVRKASEAEILNDTVALFSRAAEVAKHYPGSAYVRPSQEPGGSDLPVRMEHIPGVGLERCFCRAYDDGRSN